MIDATKKIRVDRTLNTSNINDYSARSVISATYGPAGYNSTTGVFSIPKYTSQLDNDAGFITDGFYSPGVGIQISNGSISCTVPFYSDELARLAISAGPGISYDSTTGVISNTGSGSSSGFSGNYNDLTNKPTIPTNTNQLINGSNFIALTSLSAGTGITYNNTTGVISSSITQYTDALARAAVSFTAGSGGYNSSTGVITIPTNTNHLTNGAGFLTSSDLTGYATETFVNTAVSNLVASAPAALDTLNELAAALGNDANFATTITTALGNKVNASSLSSVAISGSYLDLTNKPTIPTDTSQLSNSANFITANDIVNKQATLVSGTNIKTINGTSILGSGNITITGTGGGLSLPDQTSNSGKYLTTDGSNLSWTTIAGNSGFDFGNFIKTFTNPILYLLDTVGMDFGLFTQTENLPVDLGTF